MNKLQRERKRNKIDWLFAITERIVAVQQCAYSNS